MTIDQKTTAAMASWWGALRPPPRLSLSQWAEQHARLYDGSTMKVWPYQAGLLDCMSDSRTEVISIKKAARVGFTQMLSAAMAYFAVVEPSKQMVVQPSIEDAEDYSKDVIDNMGEWPILRDKIYDIGAKKSNNTIKRKEYPGGSLKITGANSPRAFRRIDLDKIYFDECDGYALAAGQEGDQIALGRKRLTQSLSPLLVIGSTPTVEGTSRIEDWYARGTMESYCVPCPSCGQAQPLVWGDGTGPGIRWKNGEPATAFYCCTNGCVIAEADKESMLAAGQWVAENPEAGPAHRSFHLSAIYSLLPGPN